MELINFDKEKAKETEKQVKEIQTLLKENADLYSLLEDIKYNSKEVCRYIYQEELKKVCEEFSLPFEQVNKFDIKDTYLPFTNMASVKTQNKRKTVYNLYTLIRDIDIELINKVFDNNANLVNGYNKVIDDYFTYYTKTEEQSEIVSILKKIAPLLKELAKHKDNYNSHIYLRNLIPFFDGNYNIKQDKIYSL